MEYQKTNLNPTGKLKSDCVVRAIMAATGNTWLEVYDGLCAVGRELNDMPTSKDVYSRYLTNLGWHKQKMPKTIIPCIHYCSGNKTIGETYKRSTVTEFSNDKPKGTYIVSLAGHLTTIKNGTLIDTWNCGYKSVGNYWTK